jgi:hypothetical protein
MADNDELPKTGKSADWLAHADKRHKEFVDYHSDTNMFGQKKNPHPLEDDYSKLLSKHELDARKMGMDLLKKERDEAHAEIMAKHKNSVRTEKKGPDKSRTGEVAARKPARKTSRSKSR